MLDGSTDDKCPFTISFLSSQRIYETEVDVHGLLDIAMNKQVNPFNGARSEKGGKK